MFIIVGAFHDETELDSLTAEQFEEYDRIVRQVLGI